MVWVRSGLVPSHLKQAECVGRVGRLTAGGLATEAAARGSPCLSLSRVGTVRVLSRDMGSLAAVVYPSGSRLCGMYVSHKSTPFRNDFGASSVRFYCLPQVEAPRLQAPPSWHRRGMAPIAWAIRSRHAPLVPRQSQSHRRRRPCLTVFLLEQKRMIGKRPSIGTRSGTRLTPLSPAHEPRRHRAFLSAPRSPVTGWHAGWQPWSRSSCLPIPLLTLIL